MNELRSKLTSNIHLPATGLNKLKIAGFCLVLMFSTTAGFAGGWFGAKNQQNSAPSPEAGQKLVLNESQLINQVASDVDPSIVSVEVTATSSRSDLFGYSQPIEQQGAGTGIILSKEGVVVTNRHVVPKGTTDVNITLSDGTELSEVEVIGRTNDSDTLDVAFLKIKDLKGNRLTPAKVGDSSKVKVGDKVVAIGNALGQFQNTVTAGIISGYGRDVEAADESGDGSESLQNLFQTDAAINQGNSGGPLVNINGEVIGINTAVAGGQAQNIGFAIPINDIKGLIKSVLEQGKLLRPYLGVRYVSITDDYAVEFNLPVKRGAYITPSQGSQASIITGSPAEKSGIKEKDIISKVNGLEVNEKNSLTSILGAKSVGEEVTLTVLRDGKTITIKATLEVIPSE